MSSKKSTLLLFIISTLIFHIQAEDETCTMPDRYSKSICKRLYMCDYFQNQIKFHKGYPPQNVKDDIGKHVMSCQRGTVCCPDNVVTTTTTQKITTTTPPLFDNETNLQISQLTLVNYVELNRHKNNRLVNIRGCGSRISNRIINGESVDLDEIPWAVLLGYRNERDELYWNCGGNLITKNFVLTVAHCFNNELYLARLGENKISTPADCNAFDDCVYTQDIRIQNTIVHEGYIKNIFKHDIALLKLSKPANLAVPNVKTICLPMTKDTEIESIKNKTFTISGWGYTEEGIKSDILLKSSVKLFPIEVCANSLKNASRKVLVHDENICAGGNSQLHACRGDSGGGLTTTIGKTLNGAKTYLYGLLARGIDCGNTRAHRSEYPDVYMNIKFYLDWILDNLS